MHPQTLLRMRPRIYEYADKIPIDACIKGEFVLFFLVFERRAFLIHNNGIILQLCRLGITINVP